MSNSTTMQAGEDLPPAAHFELCAYVLDDGTIHASPFEGWATFAAIFGQAPSRARYAIAQAVQVLEPKLSGAYLCWDFRDPVPGGPRHQTLAPSPRWVGKTADGLIMKAVALRGRK